MSDHGASINSAPNTSSCQTLAKVKAKKLIALIRAWCKIIGNAVIESCAKCTFFLPIPRREARDQEQMLMQKSMPSTITTAVAPAWCESWAWDGVGGMTRTNGGDRKTVPRLLASCVFANVLLAVLENEFACDYVIFETWSILQAIRTFCCSRREGEKLLGKRGPTAKVLL
jgi:hypothetical protein